MKRLIQIFFIGLSSLFLSNCFEDEKPQPIPIPIQFEILDFNKANKKGVALVAQPGEEIKI